MELAAIWAQSADGIIGADGGLPWSLPEDLAHFRAVTTGHPIVMGRRTWQSLPPRHRPLTGRTNIVLTTTPELVEEGPLTAATLEEALALAAEAPGSEKIWVIGGATLYRRAITDPRLTEVLVTTVEVRVAGDAHAPALDATWTAQEVVAPTRSRTGLTYRVDRHTR